MLSHYKEQGFLGVYAVYKLFCIVEIRPPSELTVESTSPHCLQVTWKKAADQVTGYKVYCFPDKSQKPEIVKDIPDGNQETVTMSGLKPETVYRVGITSVFRGTESKLLFTDDQLKMRMSVQPFSLHLIKVQSKDKFIYQLQFI